MDKTLFTENPNENKVCAENISFTAAINICNDNEIDNYVGESLINKIITESMHTHSYFELFICYNTGITIKTECTEIHLKPNELLLIPRGMVHTKLPSNSAWGSIGFSYNKISGTINHDFFKKIDKLCKCSSPQIITRDPKIAKEIYDSFFNKISQCNASLNSFHILDILLRISDAAYSGAVYRNDFSQKNDQDLSRLLCIEKIITRFTENISVSDAAQMLHLSERQLNRITKNNFGMSFHEAITEYKIRAAKQLLINTALSVEKISNSLGFQNKSTFYIAFKKKTGMTPAKYRSLLKADFSDL